MMTTQELDTILHDAKDDFHGVMHRLRRHILDAAAAALDEAWEEEELRRRKEEQEQAQPQPQPQPQAQGQGQGQKQAQDRGREPAWFAWPAPPASDSAFPAPAPAGAAAAVPPSPPSPGPEAQLPLFDSLPGFPPAFLSDFLPAAAGSKPPRAAPTKKPARSSRGAKVMVTAKITLDLSQSPPAWRIEASVGTRRRALGRRH